MWSWRERGLVGPLIALALVVGLVAGCGGSASPTADTLDDGSPAGGGPAGGGGPSGSDPAGGGGGGGGEAPDEGLAWVPFGPSDPTSPTPSWPAYGHLAKGDCAALDAYRRSPDGSSLGEQLGTAMVAVCQAAVEGRQEQWEVAASALAGAAAGSMVNDCLEGEVRGLLARALDWHRRYPGRRPEVRFQTAGGDGRTRCAQETDPSVTEPSVTEPSVTEPSVTEPSVTEPSVTEPTTGTT